MVDLDVLDGAAVPHPDADGPGTVLHQTVPEGDVADVAAGLGADLQRGIPGVQHAVRDGHVAAGPVPAGHRPGRLDDDRIVAGVDREAGRIGEIPVYAGFEVDFFPSAMWRNAFEKLTETLNADYYVGSFHFLRNTDESRVYNMYHYKESGSPFTPEELADAVRNYWRNVCLAAESGYFDFIAHLDVYKIFPDFAPLGTDEDKRAAVETLSRLRHPYELNTSGWTKCGEQHPYGWMLEELNKSGVPVVISDDAHDVDHLARHFERAEELLAKMNYTNRWRLKR